MNCGRTDLRDDVQWKDFGSKPVSIVRTPKEISYAPSVHFSAVAAPGQQSDEKDSARLRPKRDHMSRLSAESFGPWPLGVHRTGLLCLP